MVALSTGRCLCVMPPCDTKRGYRPSAKTEKSNDGRKIVSVAKNKIKPIRWKIASAMGDWRSVEFTSSSFFLFFFINFFFFFFFPNVEGTWWTENQTTRRGRDYIIIVPTNCIESARSTRSGNELISLYFCITIFFFRFFFPSRCSFSNRLRRRVTR